MKKFTQILNLFHTSNFIADANKEGKIIDFSGHNLFEIRPIFSLEKKMQSLDAQIINSKYGSQVFLNLPIEANVLNTAQLDVLPENFTFYLITKNSEQILYSGLDFDRKILFLNKINAATEFIYNSKEISCKTIGKANIIAENDLINFIPTNISLGFLQKLISMPLGLANKVLDLKIESGANTIIIEKDEDLNKLHDFLNKNLYKKIPLNFRSILDNSILKSYAEILVVGDVLPQNLVGIISIPKSQILSNEPDQSKYINLNNFIINMPNVKAKMNITLNILGFETGSKIFLDDTEIATPVIIDHPQLLNYKQITATINSYQMLLANQKTITIQKDKKKNILVFDPISNYNMKTKTSTIIITKQIS